jgi:hypothetical protein
MSVKGENIDIVYHASETERFSEQMYDSSPYSRAGQFHVARELLKLGDPACRLLFSQVIVIGVTFNPRTDRYTYTALCEVFAPVKPFELLPQYEAIFTKHRDGTITMEWK